MNYYLKAGGRAAKLDLWEAEFSELKKAKSQLSTFSMLTESFRVALQSYQSTEKSKHDIEFDYMLTRVFSIGAVLNARVILHAHTMGYLSCSRSFLYFVERFSSKILTEGERENLKKYRSSIYDGSPYYAFTEELRNYVQHRELPIHNYGFQSGMDDKENREESGIFTRARIRVSKQVLKRDKKFKSRVLKEMPDEIHLVEAIRHHMEGLWKIHKYLLETHFSYAESAREKVGGVIKRFEHETNESKLGLEALACEEDGTIVDKVPLLLDWDDARLDSIKGIGNLNNLPRRYVTGKIDERT